MEYDKLTEKQKRFIDYYIETGNATESAKLAGYSEKTARSIGAENLAKLDTFIQEKLQAKEDERIASQDEVLKYLTGVMRGEIKDTFDLDASITERTKAAELLGKRYCLFTEKIKADVKQEITVTLDD